MDDQRFDRLARLLGQATDRRSGLRAALAAVFGGGTAVAAHEADALGTAAAAAAAGDDADAEHHRQCKKKKPCPPGWSCVKGDRRKRHHGKRRRVRTCVCTTGITCGTACCSAGERCENGACAGGANPGPGACIVKGQPCKGTGRRCCDGLTCASGQGGLADIACYVPKTGACERTADCVYGMVCLGGRCAPPQPGTLTAPCDAANPEACVTPGAVCTAYTGTGAPDGAHCTLPLRSACSGDPECTCYTCWYLQDGLGSSGAEARGGRRGESRASTNVMGCCHPAGVECADDADCCLGLSCVSGSCGGDGSRICTPDGGVGCASAGAPCCNGSATCQNNTCATVQPPECTSDADCAGLTGQCATGVCAGGACVAQPKPNGTSCDDGATCSVGAACQGGTCVAGTPLACDPVYQVTDLGACTCIDRICRHSTGDFTCKGACNASGSGCGQQCERFCSPICPNAPGSDSRRCTDRTVCNPACFSNCQYICGN